MKLYKTTLMYHICFLADEPVLSKELVEHICEELGNIVDIEVKHFVCTREIKTEKDIPKGWGESVPYSLDYDESKTVEQLIDSSHKYDYRIVVPHLDSHVRITNGSFEEFEKDMKDFAISGGPQSLALVWLENKPHTAEGITNSRRPRLSIGVFNRSKYICYLDNGPQNWKDRLVVIEEDWPDEWNVTAPF